MGCVGGGGPPGVVCGRVLWFPLQLMMAARVIIAGRHAGTAEDCVVYQLQEKETSLVSSFGGGDIVLGVHSTHSSEFILSGLTLEVNSEFDSLSASFFPGEGRMHCKNNPNFSSTCIFYDSKQTKTWWQHISISMENSNLTINDTLRCPESIRGSDLNLTVQPNAGSALIVFNCEHGCPILDDVAVTSLDYLPLGTQIHIKNTSPDATSTLHLDSCNSSGQVKSAARHCNDQTQYDVTLTASTLGGHWNHLLFKTKEMNMSDTTKNITVVTAGTMLNIFMTSKHSKLRVVNSTNMLWAVDCDPREQVKVNLQTVLTSLDESTITPAQVKTTTTTLAQVTDILTDGGNNMAYSVSACLVRKKHWKCTAIFFILIFFILLSFIVGIFIYRHLKKRKKLLEARDTHIFVDKSENSDASQSIQLQTSHASCSSNVQILNSDSVHNGRFSVMSRSFSKDEENGFPRKYPPPPSSLPPPPTETQNSMSSKTLESLDTTVQEPSNNKEDDEHDYDYLDINVPSVQLRTSHAACSSNVLALNSNSVHNGHSIMSRSFSKGGENGFPKKFPRPPSSPPPPPMETKDSMFSKSLESLDTTVEEPSNNEEEDEHEYDYLDVNVLKQQLDKDKEEERKRQTEEETKKVEEERKRKMEANKVSLSCYDSENSLYEPFDSDKARAALVNEK